MPVGIDTSVLIAAEKQGGIEQLLPAEEGPFYIPALAATVFLIGIHPPVRVDLRQRATQLYDEEFRFMVSAFSEAEEAADRLGEAFDADHAQGKLRRVAELVRQFRAEHRYA